jgi:hypothetical protein
MSLLERWRAYLRRREIEWVQEARARGYLVTDCILPGERGNSTDEIRMAAQKEMGE